MESLERVEMLEWRRGREGTGGRKRSGGGNRTRRGARPPASPPRLGSAGRLQPAGESRVRSTSGSSRTPPAGSSPCEEAPCPALASSPHSDTPSAREDSKTGGRRNTASTAVRAGNWDRIGEWGGTARRGTGGAGGRSRSGRAGSGRRRTRSAAPRGRGSATREAVGTEPRRRSERRRRWRQASRPRRSPPPGGAGGRSSPVHLPTGSDSPQLAPQVLCA